MSQPSGVNTYTLKFVKAVQEFANEQKITDPKEVDALLGHMLTCFTMVVEAFPEADNETQRVQLSDALELYRDAWRAASRGNNLTELGAEDADGIRDIVYELTPGTLIELRDEVRERGSNPMTAANAPANTLPA